MFEIGQGYGLRVKLKRVLAATSVAALGLGAASCGDDDDDDGNDVTDEVTDETATMDLNPDVGGGGTGDDGG